MAGQVSGKGKIAIIGSHGVGKSTMCAFLNENYFPAKNLRCEVMPEVAREMPKYGLEVNEATSFEAQAKIQELQRIGESELEKKLAQNSIDFAVLDRCVLDNYAYAERRFPEKARQLLYGRVKEWLAAHPYGRIIRIPVWNPEEEIPEDGFRSTSKGFQLEIDSRITNLISELGVEAITVPEKFFLLPELERCSALTKFFDPVFF